MGITEKLRTKTDNNVRFSRILGQYSHEVEGLFAKTGEEVAEHFHCGRGRGLRCLSETNVMALIRVTSCKMEDNKTQHDMILNTAHVVVVYPDTQRPSERAWVQLVTGKPVLVCMPFEDVWQLIQRET